MCNSSKELSKCFKCIQPKALSFSLGVYLGYALVKTAIERITLTHIITKAAPPIAAGITALDVIYGTSKTLAFLYYLSRTPGTLAALMGMATTTLAFIDRHGRQLGTVTVAAARRFMRRFGGARLGDGQMLQAQQGPIQVDLPQPPPAQQQQQQPLQPSPSPPPPPKPSFEEELAVWEREVPFRGLTIPFGKEGKLLILGRTRPVRPVSTVVEQRFTASTRIRGEVTQEVREEIMNIEQLMRDGMNEIYRARDELYERLRVEEVTESHAIDNIRNAINVFVEMTEDIVDDYIQDPDPDKYRGFEEQKAKLLQLINVIAIQRSYLGANPLTPEELAQMMNDEYWESVLTRLEELAKGKGESD